MKKLLFLALLLIGLGGCQKEEISPLKDESSSTSNDTVHQEPKLPNDTMVIGSGNMTEYPVSPRIGKPNSTNYYFKVYNPSGTLALSVRLYEKATGNITYIPMTRTGGYWTLVKTISINGWYDYRYVYSGTKANISNNSYSLCNTRNNFLSSNSCGVHSICWPFGADGSSWYNRTVNSQTWRGGEETKNTSYHYGYGWNEGSHIDIDEKYSDDWNRGTGTQDLGAEIRSPLDGYVEITGQYYVSGYGWSNYVAIRQEYNGRIYRFYVGHLQSYPSGLTGKYVRAGVTKIGNLGSSGTSSPHAHTNLRDVTNNANISIPFYFNAQ